MTPCGLTKKNKYSKLYNVDLTIKIRRKKFDSGSPNRFSFYLKDKNGREEGIEKVKKSHGGSENSNIYRHFKKVYTIMQFWLQLALIVNVNVLTESQEK